MDWKRAKTLLIFMFLIINIFLSYQLLSMSRAQYKYIDKKELANVVSYLEKKNIKVEADLPERAMAIPALRVKYVEFKKNDIDDKLFSDIDSTTIQENNTYSIGKDGMLLEVQDGIDLKYKNDGLQIKTKEIDKNKCLKHAYDFIEKLNLNMEYKYVKVSENNNGYVRLVLGQQYRKLTVAESYIDIIATEEGVRSAEIKWFQTIEPDRQHSLITPVAALLKVSEAQKEYPDNNVIKGIQQGYYFNRNSEQGTDDDAVVEGIAFPMWVVDTNKMEIYINALNEKIEMTELK